MDRSYHSIQSSRSVESQPQSIVHQIIRLEKRVGKKVKKMFASKKHGDSKKSIGTEATQDSATASVDLTQSFHLESEDEYSVSSSSSSDSSCGCSSFQGSLDASIDLEWDFQTIDQNTFITKVLMDTMSETSYIIHFFNSDCLEYFDYEDQLTQILLDASSQDFELYRMNSQMAPLFTAKLAIDASKSTLIHVRKGKVVSRLEDLSDSKSIEQVRDWLVEAKDNEDFASARLPVS